MPSVASFVESPTEPGERPIFTELTEGFWDSVFIQVYVQTYYSKKFTEWLRSVVARLRANGNLRIVIINEYPSDN